MAETTIQWATYTFNPWVGCQRVSPGCEHCYAEAYDKRVGGVPKKQRDHVAALISLGHALKPGEQLLRWGPKAPRTRTSVSYWKQPLKWDRKALQDKLAAYAAGEPTPHRPRVFCASLADVFEDRPELKEWRADLFNLIDATPHLDWLLLTKRPQNIERLTPGKFYRKDARPNVWLGATVEDQQRAEERIPALISAPAAVRFLSCEPLLGPLDLSKWMDEDMLGFVNSEIDWVIIGGESGPHARPFNLEWATSLVWQCRNGGRSVEPTPFVKQLGSNAFVGEPAPESQRGPWKTKDGHGGDPSEWPESLRVREFPTPRPA
jgi:protein gp37